MIKFEKNQPNCLVFDLFRDLIWPLFLGKMIQAAYIPEKNYVELFPEAKDAHTPIIPNWTFSISRDSIWLWKGTTHVTRVT